MIPIYYPRKIRSFSESIHFKDLVMSNEMRILLTVSENLDDSSSSSSFSLLDELSLFMTDFAHSTSSTSSTVTSTSSTSSTSTSTTSTSSTSSSITSTSITSTSTPSTVLIFDWDDTLFPSEFLSNQFGSPLLETHSCDVETKTWLHTLSQTVLDLLKKSQQLGQVVIVTNSDHGWVEMSCRAFFHESVWEFLQHCPIISAKFMFGFRSLLSNVYNHDSLVSLEYSTIPRNSEPTESDVQRIKQIRKSESYQWKALAFYYILHGGCFHNLLSFGDAPHDRQTAFDVGEWLGITHVKNIQFKSHPTIHDLIGQLESVKKSLDTIYQCKGKWDLNIEKEKK